ncbi:P-loop containing nucleoside triphosphate hydrolase protein [Kockovaella imperatae]|uniref:p-loop containing nucleoside triphosphate hydrolase protein n=1 Tax=Kockovaella imperatae TaxID=4999 RepID=A0A1Y1U894_9TREE|nr:P-loop containing nucleoside triphosphate hydrolase protein [Kockovaella imperatae]ORX33335.1 P-loop containing nucleoside triphosphate hydrolase protein [Kockovaella imperatae]
MGGYATVAIHRGDLDAVLHLVAGRRQTRGTDRNDASSRSHCVLLLSTKVHRVTAGLDVPIDGPRRIIVDLAGSERMGDTDRDAETIWINESLGSLGSFFRDLAETGMTTKKRESELTMLTHYCILASARLCVMVTCRFTSASQTGHLVQVKDWERKTESLNKAAFHFAINCKKAVPPPPTTDEQDLRDEEQIDGMVPSDDIWTLQARIDAMTRTIEANASQLDEYSKYLLMSNLAQHDTDARREAVKLANVCDELAAARKALEAQNLAEAQHFFGNTQIQEAVNRARDLQRELDAMSADLTLAQHAENTRSKDAEKLLVEASLACGCELRKSREEVKAAEKLARHAQAHVQELKVANQRFQEAAKKTRHLQPECKWKGDIQKVITDAHRQSQLKARVHRK